MLFLVPCPLYGLNSSSTSFLLGSLRFASYKEKPSAGVLSDLLSEMLK